MGQMTISLTCLTKMKAKEPDLQTMAAIGSALVTDDDALFAQVV